MKEAKAAVEDNARQRGSKKIDGFSQDSRLTYVEARLSLHFVKEMNGSRKWSGEQHLSSQLNREDRHMAEGTIKKLTDKGYGFINTGGSKDLFFHSKELQGVSFDDLYEGQNVTFTEGHGPKGPCAENVRPA